MTDSVIGNRFSSLIRAVRQNTLLITVVRSLERIWHNLSYYEVFEQTIFEVLDRLYHSFRVAQAYGYEQLHLFRTNPYYRSPWYDALRIPLAIYAVTIIVQEIFNVNLQRTGVYIPATVIKTLACNRSFWNTFVEKKMSLARLRMTLVPYTKGLSRFPSYQKLEQTIVSCFPQEGRRSTRMLVRELYSSNYYTVSMNLLDPHHSGSFVCATQLLSLYRRMRGPILHTAPAPRNRILLGSSLSRIALGAIWHTPFLFHILWGTIAMLAHSYLVVDWTGGLIREALDAYDFIRKSLGFNEAVRFKLCIAPQYSVYHGLCRAAGVVIQAACQGFRRTGFATCYVQNLRQGLRLVLTLLKVGFTLWHAPWFYPWLYPEALPYHLGVPTFLQGGRYLFFDHTSERIFYETLFAVLQKTPWVNRYSNDLYTRLAINASTSCAWAWGFPGAAEVYDEPTRKQYRVSYHYNHTQNIGSFLDTIRTVLPHGISIGTLNKTTLYPFSLSFFDTLRSIVLTNNQQASYIHVDQWLARGYTVDDVARGITFVAYVVKMGPMLLYYTFQTILQGQSLMTTPFLHLLISYYAVKKALLAERNRQEVLDRVIRTCSIGGSVLSILVGLLTGSPTLWAIIDIAMQTLLVKRGRWMIRLFNPFSGACMAAIPLLKGTDVWIDTCTGLIHKLNDLNYYYQLSQHGFFHNRNCLLQLLVGSVDV